MENSEKNFLAKKYDDLHTSKEVERAVETSEEPVEQSKEARIDAYLQRIKRILGTERPGGKTGADLLIHKLAQEYVLDTSDEEKMQQLARDLYDSERQIAIERGQGDEITDLENSHVDALKEYRETLEEKRKIQEETLETWTNFLLEGDGKEYPIWFQYFIIRSLSDMGDFDRDNLRYAHRTDKTVAPFPEVNEEAIGFVFEALKTQLQIENIQIPDEVEQDIIMNTDLAADEIARIEDNAPETAWEAAKKAKLKNKRNQKRKEWLSEQRVDKQEEFLANEVVSLEDDELSEKLLDRLTAKDFSKLYAFAQVEIGGVEKLTIDGEWKKYEQGSDPEVLKGDLEGKGTGWCTATGSFAADQLEHGDFYVYYTYNSAGQATEPRVAIRQENGKVAEVRGIDTNQSMEPDLIEIAEEKYKDMPGAEKYERASHDMKLMTEIYNKSFAVDEETGMKKYLDPDLSKKELEFLYELDRKIESFGNSKDPRIREVCDKRNPEEDMLIIFECSKDKIAQNSDDINENTKAYVGPAEKDLFDKVFQYSIEHIYTSFPENRIEIMKDFEVKPITFEEFIKQTEEHNKNLTDESDQIKLGFYADDIMKNEKYQVLTKSEKMNLIKLTVSDLFQDSKPHTVGQIYSRSKELGLDLCPPETGPNLRLSDTDRPKADNYRIAMNQIPDRDGNARVFYLIHADRGLILEVERSRHSHRHGHGVAVVFRKFGSESKEF